MAPNFIEMSELRIRSLKPVDLTDMYITFLDSFSDYKVPFRLTKEQFVRKFVEKLKIDFSLSAGAYVDNSLVGFVFTAVNYYEGKLTAYNGGTGVRPANRGKKLTIRMYDYLIPRFRERRIKQCVLEVLTENDRAIKAYRSIGFRETKYFRCFKFDSKYLKVKHPEIGLEIFEVKQPNWDMYERFADQAPSFLDSSLMINDNLASETIVEAYYEGKCVGYAIYQPAFGRISQVGVAPEVRGKGVGSSLIKYIQDTSKQKILTVINIQREAENTINFFQTLGFKNQLNQYEMIMPLDS
ncbi:GNAT family N-acetyltransferase [Fulvivirga sp. 29W222]|uniref:GNAT family N-acetyltransferase n=1 Tax=Fulvivirga marina TaxID=2494733 RepID=A0A937FUL9_9BACT|nr:GNAT family N-acetyltransferase [Fulvivirga marina]MBL6446214.1 GNAT family N-acetyltransferase [Fulvivirga marina]